MGVTSGIGHLFESVIEVIRGIFAAIFNAFALVLHTIADAGKGAVHFIEGTLGFAIRKWPFHTMVFGPANITPPQTISSFWAPSPLPSSGTYTTSSVSRAPPGSTSL